jgi:hypothetical protein
MLSRINDTVFSWPSCFIRQLFDISTVIILKIYREVVGFEVFKVLSMKRYEEFCLLGHNDRTTQSYIPEDRTLHEDFFYKFI